MLKLFSELLDAFHSIVFGFKDFLKTYLIAFSRFSQKRLSQGFVRTRVIADKGGKILFGPSFLTTVVLRLRLAIYISWTMT